MKPPIGVDVEVLLVAGDPVLDRIVNARELSEVNLFREKTQCKY